MKVVIEATEQGTKYTILTENLDEEFKLDDLIKSIENERFEDSSKQIQMKEVAYG